MEQLAKQKAAAGQHPAHVFDVVLTVWRQWEAGGFGVKAC